MKFQFRPYKLATALALALAASACGADMQQDDGTPAALENGRTSGGTAAKPGDRAVKSPERPSEDHAGVAVGSDPSVGSGGSSGPGCVTGTPTPAPVPTTCDCKDQGVPAIACADGSTQIVCREIAPGKCKAEVVCGGGMPTPNPVPGCTPCEKLDQNACNTRLDCAPSWDVGGPVPLPQPRPEPRPIPGGEAPPTSGSGGNVGSGGSGGGGSNVGSGGNVGSAGSSGSGSTGAAPAQFVCRTIENPAYRCATKPAPGESGVWGGKGIGLTVRRGGADVDLFCGRGGTIDAPLPANGDFLLKGTFRAERLGDPAAPRVLPATYSGSIARGMMKLYIQVVDKDVASQEGPFTLVQGQKPAVAGACR